MKAFSKMPSDSSRKRQSSSSASQKTETPTSTPSKMSKSSESSTAATTAAHELPFSKIRSIMMSTPETMRANNEGLFAMTKAAEAFIAMLAKGAYERSKGKLIMYSNLADFVQDNNNLSHIHEMVPRKVRFSTVEQAVRDARAALKNDTK